MELFLPVHCQACHGYLAILGMTATRVSGKTKDMSSAWSRDFMKNPRYREVRTFDRKTMQSYLVSSPAHDPSVSTMSDEPTVLSISTNFPPPDNFGHPVLIAALVFLVVVILVMSIVYHRHKARMCYLQGKADAVAGLPPPLPRRPNVWSLHPTPGEYVEPNEAHTPKEISKLSRPARQRVNNVYCQPATVPKPRLSLHQYDEMAAAGTYNIILGEISNHSPTPEVDSESSTHRDANMPVYEEIGPQGLKQKQAVVEPVTENLGHSGI